MVRKKLGIIVQRYGIDINGGAEYHARLIAEKMSPFFDVEVFTSTAHDYITWKDHYPKGDEVINQIPVHRFPVKKQRDPKTFGELQRKKGGRRKSIIDIILIPGLLPGKPGPRHGENPPGTWSHVQSQAKAVGNSIIQFFS